MKRVITTLEKHVTCGGDLKLCYSQEEGSDQHVYMVCADPRAEIVCDNLEAAFKVYNKLIEMHRDGLIISFGYRH